MSNPVKINSMEDLRREKLRLRLLANEQEGYLLNQYGLLRKKVSAPIRMLNNIASYIPGVNAVQAIFSSKPGKNTGVGAQIVNVLLPLLANRFLPRKSGLMTRGLFSFLAKQVTALLTSGKLTDMVSQITALFQKPVHEKAHPFAKRRRNGRAKAQDFGIPPDSETY